MLLLQDRYRATLLGALIGDAIWAPYETMNAEAVASALGNKPVAFHKYKNPWPKDDNGAYLPAGRPTDDSDQLADLCYSLLTCSKLNPEHLTASLRESVIHGKSRLWSGHATGAGKTTRAMLGMNKQKRAAAIANPVASNGGLMRSAPLALWLGPQTSGYAHYKSLDYWFVVEATVVTHCHPDSIAATWLYVRMLRNALANRDPLDVRCRDEFDERVLGYARSLSPHGNEELPPDPGSFKAGWGGAEYTLKVALHAVLTTSSFRACIKRVGLAGGDTDTYGTVAGGLAGAIYGYKAIPPGWHTTILGHEVVEMYADELLEHRQPSP